MDWDHFKLAEVIVVLGTLLACAFSVILVMAVTWVGKNAKEK
jgi:predicted outer membrane lipoprotein